MQTLSFMFWKDCTVFLFLICLNLEPFFFTFQVFQGQFWGCCQVQKLVWDLPMQTINFCFDVQPYLFVFIRQSLGPLLSFFGALHGLLGLFFGQGQFPKSFWNYLCRQQTLVLEILPDLFIYKSAKFGAFLHFLGLTVLFLGLRSCSRSFWHQL